MCLVYGSVEVPLLLTLTPLRIVARAFLSNMSFTTPSEGRFHVLMIKVWYVSSLAVVTFKG